MFKIDGDQKTGKLVIGLKRVEDADPYHYEDATEEDPNSDATTEIL